MKIYEFFKLFSCATDRNLNPKAACLKKRDEEKTFQANSVAICGGPSPLTLSDSTPSLSTLSPTSLHPHSSSLSLTPTSKTPSTPSFPSPPPLSFPPLPTTPTTSSAGVLTPGVINSGGFPLPPQHQVQSCQQQLPFQSFPSPPPLAPGDKIPRSNEHDPPMKHRVHSGTVSPTVQKVVKGRCHSGSSIASSRSESTKTKQQQQQQ